MLKALQQIQTRRPQGPATVDVVSAEELARFGLDRQAMPWASGSAPPEAVADSAASCAKTPLQDHQVGLPRPSDAEAREDSEIGLLEPQVDSGTAAVAEPPPPAIEGQAPAVEAPPLAQPFEAEYGDLADKLLARCQTDRSTVFMFTSPGDGEGKTSTLVPLAIVAAEHLQDKVLLIDGNFLRPDVARSFGLPSRAGLGDVLNGGADWREAVCATPSGYLTILPGGTSSDWGDLPAGVSALDHLLADVRHYYRLVLLDAPSLPHPSVASMARPCDGVYLVVQLGRTGRDAIRQAVQALEEHDAHLLGCIVNAPGASGNA
jgi:Mrp family chromosome partitioning ATPase